MPSYKVHLLGGAITYALIAYLSSFVSRFNALTVKTHCLMLGFALLGSIFPDIDTPSTMQKIFFGAMIVTLPLALVYNVALFIGLSVMSLILLFLPHRSITHNLWFLVLFPGAIAAALALRHAVPRLVLFSLCISFIGGALSHCFLDFGFLKFFAKK